MAWRKKTWLVLALAASLGCEAQDAHRSYGNSTVACSLNVDGLEESSGIAASATSPGWFYTHNDDDNPMRYWKFRLTGGTLGPFTMPTMANRDVEDMASATFGGKYYLYFADIGDNAAKYDFVRVMRCEEPTAAKGEQRKVDEYRLHYPDKPKNAEAFFVQRDNEAFWIIEKNKDVAGIYRCKSPKPGENRLERVGELRLPGMIAATKLVTGAAVSADGRYVIVRTYTTAYEYSAGSDFDRWFEEKPREVKIGVEAQGEAICYSMSGQELLTTSEGKPCIVSIRPLQKLP